MPIYEYQCQKCGERIEVLQKLSDPPVDKCVSCSGEMKKLMSAPAIQFKGSGWYITDYARKSTPPPSPTEKSSSGNGGSSPSKDTKETSSAKSSTGDSKASSNPKSAASSSSSSKS